MRTIKISIPDNLSSEQEFAAIALELSTKMLIDPNKMKAIGAGYEIKELQTQIIINRVTTEKREITKVCGVCGSIYSSEIGKILYTNYGGVKKSLSYCSEECRNIVISICGDGRCSPNKNGLKPVISFR